MENVEMVLTAEQMAKDRGAWLQARQNSVGGSEVAAILGLGSWGDPFSVWNRKISSVPEEEQVDSKPMLWGRLLEDTVAKQFAEERGLKLKRSGLLRRKDKPWMSASCDRLVVGSETDGSGGVGIEIKTSHMNWAEEEVPVQYYLQCLWYMAVTGYKKWILVCFSYSTLDLVVREIERTPEVEADIKSMEQTVDKFWNEYVVPKKMPPNVNGSKHCTAAIIQQYPGKYNEAGENVLELDSTFAQKIEDIKKLEADIELMQKNVDKMKNEIRFEMKDMTFAHASYWNVSFKPTHKTTVDSKKLKERYPNIFTECSKVSNVRMLVIRESKDPKRKL